MLASLLLRDFVIVDRLDVEFQAGFTVLTGETGAGKSILIDALSLALGERGESGLVRAGCDKAEISAEFITAGMPQLQTWLLDNALASEDFGLLLRRVLYADGRSRGFINGTTVTLQQMREVGDMLVDIYSQHVHHSLLKPAVQRDLLDDYAGAASLAAQVAAAWHEWRALYERRLELEHHAAAFAAELAELRDKVSELTEISVSVEEWESLQQEHSRLAHAASLLQGAVECRNLLSAGEFSSQRQLNMVCHRLQELSTYDATLQEVRDMLEAVRIQIDEANRFLKRYLDCANLDPQRMAEVEGRMQVIHDCARKYRTRPEELPALLKRCRQRMEELAGEGDDGMLAVAEAQAKEAYSTLAVKLSAARRQASERLGREVSAEMQRLALAGGSFQVALTPLQEGSAAGLEQVEFLVAGHSGAALRPLSKVASGGELSRISLALRVVTAQQGATPTMIFDEVDVGIGGGVADVVGQLLRSLGSTRQVLVITHLPQVAAQGAVHLRVRKEARNGIILSTIETLSPEARVEEIARMLGGVEITTTTRQHAQEMLTAGALR